MKFKKHLQPKKILVATLILQALGFFIWEIYLFLFGYVENSILQARFILTGILFSAVTILIYKVLKFFIKKTSFKIPQKGWQYFEKNTLVSFGCVFIWLFFYTLFIFPLLPIFIGGGGPITLGIIAEEEFVEELKKIDITLAAGAEIQTENLCIAYQNEKDVLLLRSNRIIVLRKEKIDGFISLPGVVQALNNSSCRYLTRHWIKAGFFTTIGKFLGIKPNA